MKNEDFLRRYDASEKFDEYERGQMAFGEVGKCVCEMEGDEHRWTRDMQTIFAVGDRFFALDWSRGLTERQENEYWDQPYEVRKEQHEETIVVTNWVPIPRKE